jgi:hypothetical protein
MRQLQVNGEAGTPRVPGLSGLQNPAGFGTARIAKGVSFEFQKKNPKVFVDSLKNPMLP